MMYKPSVRMCVCVERELTGEVMMGMLESVGDVNGEDGWYWNPLDNQSGTACPISGWLNLGSDEEVCERGVQVRMRRETNGDINVWWEERIDDDVYERERRVITRDEGVVLIDWFLDESNIGYNCMEKSAAELCSNKDVTYVRVLRGV